MVTVGAADMVSPLERAPALEELVEVERKQLCGDR
jgi:hypothetical protein